MDIRDFFTDACAKVTTPACGPHTKKGSHSENNNPVTISSDELALVVSHMSADSMLTALHISREWAEAVLDKVDDEFVKDVLLKALDGDRKSLCHINDLSVRSRQIAGKYTCFVNSLFEAVDAFADAYLENPSWARYSQRKEVRRVWEAAKQVLTSCPEINDSIATRLMRVDAFRLSIDVWFIDEVLHNCRKTELDAIHHIAWLCMNALVLDKAWFTVRGLLNHGCADRAKDQIWKGALFLEMRDVRELEVKQAVAFCEALSGRNCFITGAGGCGKSHLITLLNEAISTFNKVALLAPTKVAAMRIGGQTYHSWGNFRPTTITLKDIENPRIHKGFPPAEPPSGDVYDVDSTIQNDQVFVPFDHLYLRERVANAKTIIMDEVSMMSAFHYSSLHKVVREYSRDNVQWIMVGDFCQLPSILRTGSIERAAYDKNLTERFLFETATWKNMDMFSIELDVNRRSATSADFCDILAMARLGSTIDSKRDMDTAIQSLKRITATSLHYPQFGIFPTKDSPHWRPDQPSCNMYNTIHLKSLHTDLITIDAVCVGMQPKRAFSSIPMKIHVKLGQSLRVTRGDMKNTIGTLVHVAPEYLTLETETGSMVNVDRFMAAHMKSNSVVATRSQFMVETSFGLTVHGVQSKSMRRFVVGCAGFWEHGQAYVALSRATDPSTMGLLDVENIKFICDARVKAFYKSIAGQTLPPYAC